MARIQIPVNSIVRGAGLLQPSQTNGDSSNKNYFVNDGRTLLEIVSSDAGPQTVAFEIPTPASGTDGQTVTSLSVTVAAGATRYVGSFPTAIYNQTGAQVFVDPSVSTTLKFRAYSLS